MIGRAADFVEHAALFSNGSADVVLKAWTQCSRNELFAAFRAEDDVVLKVGKRSTQGRLSFHLLSPLRG